MNNFLKSIIINIVRSKAKYIFELVTDSFKLKDEKKKFSAWKSRIEGVGSGGVSSSSYNKKSYGNDGASFYGSTSSSNYGGSISIYHERNKDKKNTLIILLSHSSFIYLH
jgi:hypothetical protein